MMTQTDTDALWSLVVNLLNSGDLSSRGANKINEFLTERSL